MDAILPATVLCPCCRAPMAPGTVPREELVGRLESRSSIFLAIVQRLAWRPGNFVSTRDLVDYVWRNDPEGGPERAATAIYNSIYQRRHTLHRLGWHIEHEWQRWRLVALTAGPST